MIVNGCIIKGVEGRGIGIFQGVILTIALRK
jgi:hypothetical protein